MKQNNHHFIYGILGAVIVFFAFHILSLNKENKALKVVNILHEYRTLNLVREYELNKSELTIELLKTKGVKKFTLDSMLLRLYYTNQNIRKRDSLYILDRYRKIN